MTPTQFRAIRTELGLSQAALAAVLGYGSPMRISEFERATNPRAVPLHVAMLMVAFQDGWRPENWPKGKDN
ncbi:helix-turn-helix domain-containing protein [Bosea sp. LjRoot237]|uniref:helix-turn-helix domain-containing protein n=1 Tax=Bosea sp. LjRoot237 TaxID=3342292 RepID=UPI003ED05F0A